MKLYFETSAQASIFLIMLPMGILLALCMDLSNLSCFGKPLWDLIVVLLFGAALGVLVILLGDTTLRIYHLLALICGWLLYRIGIRRMIAIFVSLISIRKKKADLLAGNNINESNKK